MQAGNPISSQRVLVAFATFTTSLTQTQLALDVTRAFFDAALADRLLTIAESVYNQAAATQAYAKVLDWFGQHLG